MSKQSFIQDIKGGVLPVFVLSILVLFCATALAIDFSSATRDRSKLSATADSVALQIASALPKDTAPSVEKYKAIANNLLSGPYAGGTAPTLVEFHVCTQTTADCATSAGKTLEKGQVFVSASNTTSSMLAQFYGVGARSSDSSVGGGSSNKVIKIGVESVATAPTLNFIDFYILVDISSSMGLGASPSDQTNMDTKFGCAFACHTSGTITQARQDGYKLRIDAIKDALTTMATQAKNLGGGNYRIGIYTFANKFNTILSPSASYGAIGDRTANTVYGAIKSIDIDGLAGTNLPYALRKMSEIAPRSGDGKSQASPKTYVILASDGAANGMIIDYDAATKGYNWHIDPNWNEWIPNKGYATDQSSIGGDGKWIGPALTNRVTCPDYDEMIRAQTSDDQTYLLNLFNRQPTPCISEPAFDGFQQKYFPKDPNAVSQDSQWVQQLNPSWCDAIKTKGANMMTLYTTYEMSLKSNQAYMRIMRYNIAPKIAPAMQACASSSDFALTASDAAGIDTAFKQLLSKAMSATRIVR